jgi:hypothetical protein
VAVKDADPDWGKYQANRDRVSAVLAGREEAIGLIVGMPGWRDDTLGAYRDGAYFLPMVSRTLETFGGLVFLKAPTRTFPVGLEAFTDDVTGTGQEIDRFAEAAFDAVLKTSATGVLVDYPQAPTNLTKAEAQKQGFRPTLRLYDANSILAARVTTVDGVQRLTHVRLLEDYTEAGTDEFTISTRQQVRVLDLDGGFYRQRVFREQGGVWTSGEVVEPTMAGVRLTSIPMFFSSTRDGEPRCDKPPLLDLSDINVAHLQNSAAMEWALMWLGNPILFGSGIKVADGETLAVGSSQAVLGPIGSTLEIVQADGESVGALKRAMDDKRRDAAALGARMLMESPRAAIAAETARIERAGEASVIGAVANAVSQCLTNALRLLAEWAGVSGSVVTRTKAGEPVVGADGKPVERPLLYWLNTDLMPTRMSAQDLEALLKAWQAGALSKRELFSRFQEAEVVDPAEQATGDDPRRGLAGRGA